MPGFESTHATTRLLDLIRRVTKNELQKERPAYRYAVVDSIDRYSGKCGVIFVGEEDPVIVNLGSIQPMLVGQTVRVDGLRADRFVSDVIGPHWHGQLSFDKDSSVSGGGGFVWSQPGVLQARGGSMGIPADTDQELSVFVARVGTAPTGQAIKLDVKKNLTTSLFDDYVSIPVGTNFVRFEFDNAVAQDDVLTLDVIQIGTTEPGRDLVAKVV